MVGHRRRGLLAALVGAFAIAACGQNASLYEPTPEMLGIEAPDSFLVGVETSEGYFEIKMHRAWSPLAVDRIHHLMRNDFYAGARVYRMIPGFVAQFGFSGDPLLDSLWRDMPLEDEPVIGSNQRGVVSFASAGPNTRSYTIFINLDDNSRLDDYRMGDMVGYPPIGVIESGVEIVEGFYAAYDMDASVQDSIRAFGNDYLRRNYPQLDSIVGTRVVTSWQ